jgi:DNA invertase Pin-like site-specific DNA recombinase
MLAIAEMERNMIVERTQEGKALARQLRISERDDQRSLKKLKSSMH